MNPWLFTGQPFPGHDDLAALIGEERDPDAAGGAEDSDSGTVRMLYIIAEPIRTPHGDIPAGNYVREVTDNRVRLHRFASLEEAWDAVQDDPTDVLSRQVEPYVRHIMEMIRSDVGSGLVGFVRTFAELHEYVDANTYAEDANVPDELINAVETEVGRRLADITYPV